MSVGPPGGVVRQSADPSLLSCRGGLHRERGAEYRAVLASPTLWQTANRGVLPIGPGGRAHPASDSLTAWLLGPAILLTSLSVGLGGEGERGARQGAAAFSRTGALVLATLGGRARAVSPTCLGASACPPGGGSPTPRGHTAPRPRSGFASLRSEPPAWRRGGRRLSSSGGCALALPRQAGSSSRRGLRQALAPARLASAPPDACRRPLCPVTPSVASS